MSQLEIVLFYFGNELSYFRMETNEVVGYFKNIINDILHKLFSFYGVNKHIAEEES